jgi:ribosome biogenesis protein ENP2
VLATYFLFQDLVRNKASTSTVGQQNYGKQRQMKSGVRLVPLRTRGSDSQSNRNRDLTFGQRRSSGSRTTHSHSSTKNDEHVGRAADGGMEISWVPSSKQKSRPPSRDRGKQGVESFGLGMEKGGRPHSSSAGEAERNGRTQRRKGMRSGSKNAFRRI